jgi:hypothetical protein
LLPLSFFPHFFDFASDQVALQHAQVLQKQYAVQVVNLVAKRSR